MADRKEETAKAAQAEQRARDITFALKGAERSRRAGDLRMAARGFDAVLKAAPGHPDALAGRARVALARCESDALARFDQALRARPSDGDLHLGLAQALDLAGDHDGAALIAAKIAAQAPGFIPALHFASSLALARQDEDFTRVFREASEKRPQDPNIPAAHCAALAGIEHYEQAGKVASQSRERFPDEPYFALLEATYAGSTGNLSRAEAIFATLTLDTPGRWMSEARHRLRQRDLPKAHAALDRVMADQPYDVAAWALRGVAWRLGSTSQDKERAHWLHEQAGLVQSRMLVASPGLLERAASRLRELHAASGMPLNQSLRGGSQTRGLLFERLDPVLEELHAAIGETLAAYHAALPPIDDTHPLLRERDAPWKLAGSWSVRLTGEGDHHASHIHPQGLLSSALYIAVPKQSSDPEQRAGWLEIGRPPPDLLTELGPLRTIEPIQAHMALFPSTLYHGTTPLRAADNATLADSERMTVAFDVIAPRNAAQ